MSNTEQQVFHILQTVGILTAAIVFIILFFIVAPYGRHIRTGWGPHINARAGWVIMEFPSALAISGFFLLGNGIQPTVAWIFIAMWLAHYGYRTLVYPFRLRAKNKTTPLTIVASAIVFNVFNGYLNGRYLGVHAGEYTITWLQQPQFIVGTLLFLTGWAINFHSDEILLKLRTANEQGYNIPHGGLYRWVSCPNYLGELIEWCGFALATFSIPGLVFALWTAANLVPRAHAHHRWYRETFNDYPPHRRAIVPYLF